MGDEDFAEELGLRGESSVGAAPAIRGSESSRRGRDGGNVHCLGSSLFCRVVLASVFRGVLLEQGENLFGMAFGGDVFKDVDEALVGTRSDTWFA